MDPIMKSCPRCGLLYPETVTTCPCGFDLVHGNAASVRGVLRRRGRKHIVSGIVLIVLGLFGGMAFLPIRMSLFFNIGSYRIDLGLIIAGTIILARGCRILDRPWTEDEKKRRAG